MACNDSINSRRIRRAFLISTDLEAYVEQMEAQMIIGEIDIETGFDTMVKGCQDRNLSRYLQILQTAYDRYVDAL